MAVKALAARLESHVRMLAENIGERNVYHSDALAEASAYIENVWQLATVLRNMPP
jgi:division protein CdvB (Snf7/Vps24/ESCRT-III family)